jgi:hypothetical protein
MRFRREFLGFLVYLRIFRDIDIIYKYNIFRDIIDIIFCATTNRAHVTCTRLFFCCPRDRLDFPCTSSTSYKHKMKTFYAPTPTHHNTNSIPDHTQAHLPFSLPPTPSSRVLHTDPNRIWVNARRPCPRPRNDSECASRPWLRWRGAGGRRTIGC